MAYTVTLESIASFSDVEERTTHAFTANELVVVHNLLASYQGEIETRINRPLSVVVTEEPVRRAGGPGEDSVVLTRFRPVTSITATLPIDLVTRITSGIVYIQTLVAPSILGLDDISAETISYRAGVAPHELAAIKSIMCDRIIRTMVKMSDDAEGTNSIGEAGYSATYIDEGFLPHELASLPPRKRNIG